MKAKDELTLVADRLQALLEECDAPDRTEFYDWTWGNSDTLRDAINRIRRIAKCK